MALFNPCTTGLRFQSFSVFRMRRGGKRRLGLSPADADLNEHGEDAQSAQRRAGSAPYREKEEPVISTMQSPASRTGTDSDLVGEQFGDALSDLGQRLGRLDQRIQQIESVVTDRSFDWDRRLRARP